MDFKESTISNYSGLSSETKPTIAAGTNVPNGSRWREVDTGVTLFFDLATDTWYNTAPTIDPVTPALETITTAHHELHSGSHYSIEGHQTLDSGVSFFVKLVTPDTTKLSHFIWSIAAVLFSKQTYTKDQAAA